MSTAVQTIAIQKILLRHDFTEQEAGEILNYVDGKESNKEILTQVGKLDKQINKRIDALDGRIDTLEKRVDLKINGLDAKVNGLDAKVNSLDAKVNNLDTKVNVVDKRLVKLETGQVWLKWIMGIGFAVVGGGLLTVMLYLHGDTGKKIEKLDGKIEKLETNIDENRKLLMQVIQQMQILQQKQ